jgi:hypothetical protein
MNSADRKIIDQLDVPPREARNAYSSSTPGAFLSMK